MSSLESLTEPYKNYGILFKEEANPDGLNVIVINEVNGKEAIAELPIGDGEIKQQILEEAVNQVNEDTLL